MKKASWLRGILGGLGFEQDVTLVHCDSHNVIHLAMNQTYYSKMKHIDVRYNFIKDIVDDGDVVLEKILTPKGTQLK